MNHLTMDVSFADDTTLYCGACHFQIGVFQKNVTGYRLSIHADGINIQYVFSGKAISIGIGSLGVQLTFNGTLIHACGSYLPLPAMWFSTTGYAFVPSEFREMVEKLPVVWSAPDRDVWLRITAEPEEFPEIPEPVYSFSTVACTDTPIRSPDPPTHPPRPTPLDQPPRITPSHPDCPSPVDSHLPDYPSTQRH